MDHIATSNNFIKFDDALGIVTGWAIVCMEKGERYFDLHGDHIPEAAAEKANVDFMVASRTGKEMHVGDVAGTIVESLCLTTEKAAALNIQTERTGLIISFKPTEKACYEKFKDGTYKGFSIGGSYGETEEIPDA